MIRRQVHAASVATLVETLNVAVQPDDEDELSFSGLLKGRFVEGVHRAARTTVGQRNTPGMTMAELAGVAQTKGDKHRGLRLEQHKERTTERKALAE